MVSPIQESGVSEEWDGRAGSFHVGGVNQKVLTTTNLESENQNAKRGLNNRTSVNFGLDIGMLHKGQNNYIDDLILEEEEIDLSEDEDATGELLINENPNKSAEKVDKMKQQKEMKLREIQESGLEGIQEMKEEMSPRSGEDLSEMSEHKSQDLQNKETPKEESGDVKAPSDSQEKGVEENKEIEQEPETESVPAQISNTKTSESEIKTLPEESPVEDEDSPETQDPSVSEETTLAVQPESEPKATSVNEAEAQPESSLQPVFKFKIAGKSMQIDEVQEEFKYAFSGGDTALTYNQDFFKSKQEEERVLMYNGAVRFSIKKVLFKLEKKILAQVNTQVDKA